ncbi:MAG: hypothetical protein WC747_03500 [Candidatus Babeliales bacterium]
MKLFQGKIIFLLTLFCVQNQQASEAQKGYHVSESLVAKEAENKRRLTLAIEAVDCAFTRDQCVTFNQMDLVREAIEIRKFALKDDVEINCEARKAQKLYFKECLVEKRNHVTEVLYSQAIIAFLQGQLELGNKYVSEADLIKNKQFEKIATRLELLNQ